jgi:hypothetical protein
MAVVRVACRGKGAEGTWVYRMLMRKPPKLVAVALANKMARSIWAMLTKQEDFRVPARCQQRSEARSPTGAEPRATYLYSVDPKDLDHDAVMRIGGRAPERWAHSTRRLEIHSWVRVTTISDRHRLPAPL